MKNEIYVVAKYRNYSKLIGLPFRPMKDDRIIDEGIGMTVHAVTFDKQLEDGIIMTVSIHNVIYHDVEEQHNDMISKGWKTERH